ncbi:MAG: DNA helicase [bacterium]|nr:DNA helicase [bacterium]
MPSSVPPFQLNFERKFLKNYSQLTIEEQKLIDKTITFLSINPRHPVLNTHKATNVKAKYKVRGDSVFIAYASRKIRITFEYGPRTGMITIRNCGYHDECEGDM